jgi:hypothetical protein
MCGFVPVMLSDYICMSGPGCSFSAACSIHLAGNCNSNKGYICSDIACVPATWLQTRFVNVFNYMLVLIHSFALFFIYFVLALSVNAAYGISSSST